MAPKALRCHIQGLEEDGDSVPEPMRLDEALRHEFARDAQAFFLVDPPPS